MAIWQRRVADRSSCIRIVAAAPQPRPPTLSGEKHAAVLDECRRSLRRQRRLRGFLRQAQARARQPDPMRDVRIARADLFDDIERFHDPRMRRSIAWHDQWFSVLSEPSVITGQN